MIRLKFVGVYRQPARWLAVEEAKKYGNEASNSKETDSETWSLDLWSRAEEKKSEKWQVICKSCHVIYSMIIWKCKVQWFSVGNDDEPDINIISIYSNHLHNI